MISAVDTNILLDMLIPNEEHMKGSKSLLEDCLEKGRLVICEIVNEAYITHYAISCSVISLTAISGEYIISGEPHRSTGFCAPEIPMT